MRFHCRRLKWFVITVTRVKTYPNIQFMQLLGRYSFWGTIMIYAGSKFAQCFSDFFVINDIDFAAYADHYTVYYEILCSGSWCNSVSWVLQLVSWFLDFPWVLGQHFQICQWKPALLSSLLFVLGLRYLKIISSVE